MDRAIDLLKQPLLARSHRHCEEKVKQLFPHLQFKQSEDAIVLKDFVKSIPQKYFSEDFYWRAVQFFQEFSVEFHSSYIHEISRALVALKSINNKDWHNTEVPTGLNVADKIGFIEDDFLQAYLQLAESVWYVLLKPFGEASRKRRGKPVEGLSLKMLKQEMRDEVPEDYRVLHDSYLPVIRNGIAHNSIVYDDFNVTFFDRFSQETMPYEDFIQLVDKFLDCCNALYLLFLSFYLTKETDVLPEAILFEKISMLNNCPWLHVNRIIPSFIHNQLVASITLKTKHEFLAQHSVVKLLFDMWSNAQKYNRYFLYISSPHCLASTAYFSAESLSGAMPESLSIEEFISRTKRLLMWKKNVLRITKKNKLTVFNNLYNSIKVNWPTLKDDIVTDFKNQVGIPLYSVKYSSIHENGYRSVVKAAIVLDDMPEAKQDIINSIYRHSSRLFRAATKHARRNTPVLSHLRYRVTGYIEVCIYAKDYRNRTMRRLSMNKDLICRMVFHGIKRIRTIPLQGSEVVVKGMQRYEWNRAWLDCQ